MQAAAASLFFSMELGDRAAKQYNCLLPLFGMWEGRIIRNMDEGVKNGNKPHTGGSLCR